MNKIKFALIGLGWRAEYFVRVAKHLSDVFELTTVYARNVEKGLAFSKKFNIPVVNSLDELINTNPDYVILCVSAGSNAECIKMLFEKNLPILCETPPALNLKDLKNLWEVYKKYDGKIQITEQYFLHPLYNAWSNVISSGKLGEIQNMSFSAIHGYHAVSIIRKYLNTAFQNCKIIGCGHDFKVTKTFSREGITTDGEIMDYKRQRLTLEFENGKTAFLDFSPIMYHSFIRARHLTVEGTRGEIDDLEIRYLNSENEPILDTLIRRDIGVYNIQDWEHYGIMLGSEYVYKNPFKNARLNDDEIAVATCMLKMYDYVKSDIPFYGLDEAMQDAYISFKMQEALENSYVEVSTTTQPWAE